MSELKDYSTFELEIELDKRTSDRWRKNRIECHQADGSTGGSDTRISNAGSCNICETPISAQHGKAIFILFYDSPPERMICEACVNCMLCKLEESENER